MANLMFLISVLTFCSIIDVGYADSCNEDKVVFCYYSSWAVYRPKYGSFNISNIDTGLCTHYVYSFAGVGLEGLTIALEPGNDLPENGNLQQYYHFRMMKEENPCIKVLLSIGGWNEGSEKYSIMAETEKSRTKFVDHLLRFLVFYGFDGVDLDWEYPATRGGIAADKNNFIALLKEMKARLGPRKKLISTAVGAGDALIDTSYDVKAIADTVDFVLLMTYDYNNPNFTTHLAPLRRESEDYHLGSVADSVKNWLDNGCPASKLVMGIQTSGRTYNLTSPDPDPAKNGVGSPVSGAGNAGELTGEPGFLAYYEICRTIITDPKWHVVRNQSPFASSFATKGNQWITFEDTSTVYEKAKFAADQKLRGILVWTIDTDDFNEVCSNKANVLQRSMLDGFGL